MRLSEDLGENSRISLVYSHFPYQHLSNTPRCHFCPLVLDTPCQADFHATGVPQERLPAAASWR